jgi:propanol-preferring alcohol dehydrogenase
MPVNPRTRRSARRPTVSGRTWSWASWGPTFVGIPYEVSVQTTYGGNRAEFVEVLDLAARGLLHAEITRFELDQAEHAYEQLGSGAVDGRVVVVPNGA